VSGDAREAVAGSNGRCLMAPAIDGRGVGYGGCLRWGNQAGELRLWLGISMPKRGGAGWSGAVEEEGGVNGIRRHKVGDEADRWG
jgi:hypothetical protein